MKITKFVLLIVVSIIVAILLASALNNFTRTSDSALAQISPPRLDGGASVPGEERSGGVRGGGGGNAPRTAPGKNYLPIIFLNAPTDSFWSLAGNSGTLYGTNFLGTTDNISFTIRVSNTVAFRIAPTNNTPNIIGGYNGNTVSPSAFGATISGGGGAVNSALSGCACSNVISGTYATISGGTRNTAGSNYSTVSGGDNNTASGTFVAIGGGISNKATANYSTIGGGDSNSAGGFDATVGGGYGNSANNFYTMVGGGYQNTAGGLYAGVGAGSQNNASGITSTIAGGQFNLVQATGAMIGGGYSNTITTTGTYAFIGAGSGNTIGGDHVTIGGGNHNTANGYIATIGGGFQNTASNNFATVGGGAINTASGAESTVSGGSSNTASNDFVVIGGGRSNTANNSYATVGGGGYNTASGQNATIGGGNDNIASNDAATVSGGVGNTASGFRATVAGGSFNVASGNYSFAAGALANTNNQSGAFVWADSTGADLNATIANQFLVRASGGITLYTDSGASVGASLYPGSGSWNTLSNKNMKANFTNVDTRDILARVSELPITIWNYKTQDASIRHIGPMAQDFAAAFNVGENDTTISTVDAQGVALAAIQGLAQENQDLKAQVVGLRQQNANLEARVSKIDQVVGIQSPAWWTNPSFGWGIALLVVGLVVGRRLRREQVN